MIQWTAPFARWTFMPLNPLYRNLSSPYKLSYADLITVMRIYLDVFWLPATKFDTDWQHIYGCFFKLKKSVVLFWCLFPWMLSPAEYLLYKTSEYKQCKLKINSEEINVRSRLPVNYKVMHQLVCRINFPCWLSLN